MAVQPERLKCRVEEPNVEVTARTLPPRRVGTGVIPSGVYFP